MKVAAQGKPSALGEDTQISLEATELGMEKRHPKEILEGFKTGNDQLWQIPRMQGAIVS